MYWGVMCASCSVLPRPPKTERFSMPATAATPAAEKPAAVIPPAPHPLEKPDLEAFLDGIVPLQLERSDVAGATVLLMKDGNDLLRKDNGFSAVSKKKPYHPESARFLCALHTL